MVATFHAELTVSRDSMVPGIVDPLVREGARRAGFPSQEVETLVAAVEQAAAAIMQRAFDPNEPGTLRFTSDLTPVSWTLAIYEQGLPLDVSVEEITSGSAGSGHASAPVWAHVHQAVDEAHWVHHGPAGSELRLVKYRRQGHVTEQGPVEGLARAGDEVPQAPEQEYVIRRLRAEEAIHVAQCVYRAYGFSYPNEDLYYPERIVHLNATGELISAVAVDEAGEVVGHLALERPGLGTIAESGQAVVIPAHRGRHLFKRLRQFLEDEGRRMGLVHIWSEPVTSHVFSQQVDEELGARVCGVSFAASPRTVDFKAIRTAPLPQRGSCMLYVKYLSKPPAAVVHAPPHHRDMLERIYAHLDAPATFGEPGLVDGPGRIAVSLDRVWGVGKIRVLQCGVTSPVQIHQALRDLVAITGVEVVYLDLPLAQPGAPELCVAAENEGFFFGGVAPLFARDGDALRMQYLNVDYDPSLVQVASPVGRELVAYAANERQRVMAARGGSDVLMGPE